MSSISLLSHFTPPASHKLNPLEAAKGFATDIVKRTGLAQQMEALREQSPELSDDMAKRVAAMEKSLETTIQYLTQQHGKGAATAAMGIIYKTVGENPITEATLGDALLDVTRFIDTQFGFAQGDDFIHHLNSDLNNSLNELFQNGETEIFVAVTSVDGKSYSTADAASSKIILKSLSQAISDNLTDVDEFTEKILKNMQEKRHTPNGNMGSDSNGMNTGLQAHEGYGSTAALPTGIMVNSAI